MAKRETATEVDGHKIQKPRLLDAKHDREISRRNDAAIQRLSQQDNPKAKETK